jgi:hypothetical protein
MFGKVHGATWEAKNTLLRTGSQIVQATWGIPQKELHVLPPVMFRIFGFSETVAYHELDGKEVDSDVGVGDDIGDVKLPNGSTVSAGRPLMSYQRNTALYDPL